MDVTKLTAEQSRRILDFVLENSYHPKDYIHVKEFFLTHGAYFPNKDEYLLRMTLNKLNQDGYIDFIGKRHDGRFEEILSNRPSGEGIEIRRNFDGHIFIDAGGYEGEYRRLETTKKLAVEAARKAEINELKGIKYTARLACWTQCLFWGTILVGLATLALVAVELFASHEPIVKTYLVK